MRRSHKKQWLWLLVPLVVVFVACVILVPARRKAHTRPVKLMSAADRVNDFFYPHSMLVLNSREKYGAVHVPLTMHDNLICVQTTWSGRPLEAIVDTGSYAIVWPATLHLISTDVGPSGDSRLAAGIRTPAEWTILPSLRAGGCEWQRMPTLSDGRMESSRSSQTATKTLVPPKPLLGAPAFQRGVLTIDYQRKEIVVRGPAYDITRLPRHAHDLLLTPDWEDGYLPILKGTLDGRPARFALDSGCWAIPVNVKFATHLPASYFGHGTWNEVNGLHVTTRSLKLVTGQVAGIQFREPEASVLEMPIDADAIVGMDLLRQFRVTIDYKRGKILMEPYSGGGQ